MTDLERCWSELHWSDRAAALRAAGCSETWAALPLTGLPAKVRARLLGEVDEEELEEVQL